ncbi:MAG: AAA family ATPase [Burkholderiales bacterium]
MSLSSQRLLELIEYVGQSSVQRQRPVAHVADHGRFLLFAHQLGGIDGVRLDVPATETEEAAWLRMVRPPNPELPPSIESPWLAPWLEVGQALTATPHLAGTVRGTALIAAGTHRDAAAAPASVSDAATPAVAPDAQVPFAAYAFRDEVERQFNAYVEGRWRPWAEAERKRRRASRLYMQFVSLHQELAGTLSDGQVELVWGAALAPTRGDSVEARYPLVTQGVDLLFDAATGAVRVCPRDVDARLDLEPFDGVARSEASRIERRAAEWFAQAELDFSPFDAASHAEAVDAARTLLPVDADIDPSWVLFARPKNTTPMIQDLERFARALRDADADPVLPPAVAALVSDPADTALPLELPRYRGVSEIAGRTGPDTVRDLYFPLPFNDEQMRIVQLLEARDGVVVQGPPGTGKTHTIANIVCHWLAHGRRVLVTSMKEPALAVLRDKLPEEIQPLALPLLAGDSAGMQAFERAIQHIATQVQSLDQVTAAAGIGRLEEEIDALQTRIARIDEEIATLAQRQLAPIELEGERVDPLDAASAVAAASDSTAWLQDALGPDAKFAPRFDDAELAQLFRARTLLGNDLRYAGIALPDPDGLPQPDALLDAHRRLVRLAQMAADSRGSDTPVLAVIDESTDTHLRRASACIDRVRSLRATVSEQQTDWSRALAAALGNPDSADAIAPVKTLVAEVREIAEAWQPFVARPVSVPAGAEFDMDVTQAVRNLAAGRRAFGLTKLFRPEARSRLAAFFIDGRLPDGPDDWQHVADALAVRIRWRTLAPRWNAAAASHGLPTVTSDEASGIPEAARCVALVDQVSVLAAAEADLAATAQTLFPGWSLARRLREEPAAIRGLERAIDHYLNAQQLADVWQVREKLREALGSSTGGVFDDIRTFAAETLGNVSATDDAVVNRWFALLTELKRLRGQGEALDIVARVTAAIDASGAPRLAESLRVASGLARETLVPADWRESWRLRRLATHLDAVESGPRILELSGQRSELEHYLARSTRLLVVQRAWLRLAESATPGVRAALQAYLSAVQRMGKGTGKRAARYRQDAREAAAQAQAAVPCWIMPHHRISESLPPRLGAFDLVIIDEASQSDLSALPAMLRGCKLLIVGDDRQVSPDPVGLEEERIRSLMQRHLAAQVPIYRMQMSPERSIYDLARVVFASNGVMLKEHFRCVAPIIEYAKREFYGDELRPLRLPVRSRRLDPPLIDVYLQGAERVGDANPAEAAYIVDEIARLTGDPKMRGRTIGVVSLQGEEQAALVQEQLADRLGPAVLQAFSIACGDAKTFQGRERDIMFLSMVVAPNAVGGPLSRDTFAQRFNVAASRARDRMVLVRSVMLRELPDSDRLRFGLIAHFHEPFGRPAAAPASPRERCESPLERSLYDWLHGRGYRVTPRVPVGTCIIDLVVEGANDTRLAIECDGDRSLDASHWITDVARQRVLERAGWTFHRCFATRFVLQRERVLAELEAALASHGIRPLGTHEDVSSALTEHRVIDASACGIASPGSPPEPALA